MVCKMHTPVKDCPLEGPSRGEFFRGQTFSYARIPEPAGGLQNQSSIMTGDFDKSCFALSGPPDPMDSLPRAAAKLATLALPGPGLICLGRFGAEKTHEALASVTKERGKNNFPNSAPRLLASVQIRTSRTSAAGVL